MATTFEAIFTQGRHVAARAKFLSRVFGIFSEEIVRLWASDPRAPYKNLPGRPTLRSLQATRGHTLDFLLEERSTGKKYVTEMKCEIEYQGFRYFVLEDVQQLAHHKKEAFKEFLVSATPRPDQKVTVEGSEIQTDGAILIWGSVTTEARQAVRSQFGLHDVLSIAEICRDLSEWRHEGYLRLLSERQVWNDQLFAGLRDL